MFYRQIVDLFPFQNCARRLMIINSLTLFLPVKRHGVQILQFIVITFNLFINKVLVLNVFVKYEIEKFNLILFFN